MKTFHIKTLGCKVNQYDSQVIREQFLDRGFREVNGGFQSSPDICIVNTCSVTNRAQAKGRNYINHLRRHYPETTLIVTGCTVDYQPESAGRKADLLVSNRDKFSLINILFNKKKIENDLGIRNFAGRIRAFVKVQDGCNEFCSYCVLPYVRGRSRSRDFKEVIKEVKRLVDYGYREIILTGIHLGDYGKDKDEKDLLVYLLKELEKIPDLIRIRLSSLEPQDITDQLVEKIAVSNKICRHLHIPLQSGDDIMLKNMNRKYIYGEYRSLLNRIVSKIPEISFTTDVMVGFPGETEEQFLNSCRAVEEIGFVKVHIFPYSLRPGTKAEKLAGRILNRDIKRRAKALDDIAKKVSMKMKKKLIGSLQDVLVEKSEMESVGYTSGYIPVKLKESLVANVLVRIRVIGIEEEYLIATEP